MMCTAVRFVKPEQLLFVHSTRDSTDRRTRSYNPPPALDEVRYRSYKFPTSTSHDVRSADCGPD